MKTAGRVPPESQLQREKIMPVKLEVEDHLVDRYGPLHKRSKISSSFSQHHLGNNKFVAPPSEYNPLDEPSPLGLRLRKSPSLLDLIQMRLSEGNTPKAGGHVKKEKKGGAASSCHDKLKASNFPASILKIGTWEYKSKYEGDLVAKCYFAKHKLVWEVLDGGLKNKIEIQWSDIMALKATYPDDEPGTLDVALVRQPLFFKETNPQPRKHTLWQSTPDFTGGQASINRRHYLQCPPGLLGKHFEKLIQCDPRLNYLSQQAEISLESPYFETMKSVVNESDEPNNEYDINSATAPAIFDLKVESPSGPHSSSLKYEHDFIGRHSDHFPHETPSPSSDIKSSGIEEWKNLSCWDCIKVPGSPSMSMNDLVSHIEHQISEHRTSNNPILPGDQRQSLEILEKISRCLFTDSRHAIPSDEKSVMSRVNSLCCLLQKEPTTIQNFPLDSGNGANTTIADKKRKYVN